MAKTILSKEIIKYYLGDFINPLGRAHLLLVGDQKGVNLSLEYYLIFEHLAGGFSAIAQRINTVVIAGYSDTLEMFMEEQGLKDVKSIVMREVHQEINKRFRSPQTVPPGEFEFRPATEVDWLMFMLRKSKKKLVWIERSTHSTRLRDMIRFIKGREFVVRTITGG